MGLGFFNQHSSLESHPGCYMYQDLFLFHSDWCRLVGWASSYKVKGHQFNSWSGHMPGLQVQSQVGAHTRSNESVFLSRIDVSLPLFLPLFRSL